MTDKSKKPAPRARGGRRRIPRWVRWSAVVLGVPALVGLAVAGYYYVTFSRLVDARLRGERARAFPRVYARPLELRRGQAVTEQQLVDRLNDLGYAQRASAAKPGEFALDGLAVTIVPRGGEAAGRPVRAVFRQPAVTKAGGPPAQPDRLDRVETVAGPAEAIALDPPLLTAMATGDREKRRLVRLGRIPPHVVQAVLAIEDRRFYEHPGVDPVRIAGAAFTNMFGDKPYLVGGSTITQQLVKNVFLASVITNPKEKSYKRKLLEQFMAVVLERRASKDEILELYLNEVYLGQRGSFAIHGVAEGAKLFFGKDVANLTLPEAATMAGVIHSPYYLSPFTSPERARDRRNVVLKEMADAGYVAPEAAEVASREALTIAPRALEAEAPYFVDLIGQQLAEQYPALLETTGRLDVHTSLDLHLQRLAQDAVREGLLAVDDLLARRKRKGMPQAALLAVDARSGEILAWVGGRSYNQSQYNRVTTARRQPGSIFKPFVYLAAFEQAADEGRADLTPATLVLDEPTAFLFGEEAYEPRNYEDEYDGPITLRRALAHSRNCATVRLAETIGYDKVASLWKRFGTATAPKPYPSIALGAFEATPFEIATAYTVFPNLGEVKRLHAIRQINADGRVETPAPPAPLRVTRATSAYLVENMLRSVVNEGTGAAVRGSGFALDAGGKTGTTNDLRDAWFVGFTAEVLTVVWVGFDDNQALGLSGAQAALPIWTSFMTRALAGHANTPLPEGGDVVYVEIDRDNGKLAVPGCPRTFREAFAAGTEPLEQCELHRF